jgi:hypothetical protein
MGYVRACKADIELLPRRAGYRRLFTASWLFQPVQYAENVRGISGNISDFTTSHQARFIAIPNLKDFFEAISRNGPWLLGILAGDDHFVVI